MIGFPLRLPIDATAPRKWSIAEHCGETFAVDEYYDGIALTLELRSPAEARAVAAALFGLPVAVPVAQPASGKGAA